MSCLAVWMAIWLSATAALWAWEWLRSALLSVRNVEGPLILSRYIRVAVATTLGLVAVAVTLLINQPAPDIVYKAF